MRTSRTFSNRFRALKAVSAVATVVALGLLGVSAPAFADAAPTATPTATATPTPTVTPTPTATATPRTTPAPTPVSVASAPATDLDVHRVHVPKPATPDQLPAAIVHSPTLNKDSASMNASSVPYVATSGATVAVSGHIYLGTSSTPAAGVSVIFCAVGPNSLGGACPGGYTDSAGAIVLDAQHLTTPVTLPANTDYIMQVQNQVYSHFVINLQTPQEPGVTCAQQSNDGCTFSAGTADVSGVDAILPAAATISGTVTADGGATVNGIAVYLDQWNPETSEFEEYEQVSSGSDGTFTFGGVPGGDYAIEYVDVFGRYAYQEFDDESMFYEPDVITVEASDNVTGADAQLHLVGTISGTISTPGGTSSDLAGGALSAEIQVFDGPSQSWVDTGYYTTVTNGTYSLNYLAPDTYRVRVDYVGEVNAATFVGPPVIVTAGHTTTYNTTVNVTGPYSTDSSIDSITGSAAGVTVAGWAVYPASDPTTVGVALNIGSKWYSLAANHPNPEVVAAEGVFGITVSPNHGFAGTTLVAPGTYNACIWVTEPTGPSVNIGCQTVTVPVPGATIAKLDSATGSAAGITVSGYALYPNNDAASVGVAVNIGAGWYGLTANKPSTEATTDVPGAGPNHGYSGTIAIAPGTYSACIWVTEPSGPAVNTGCHPVVVPAPAATTYGLDSLTGSTAGVSVAGWALYPDSPASSVGIALNIGAGWYGFTANQANSDAGAGTNHGYSGSVALAPGTYNVCVWVTEPSGPALNTGCQSVVVTAPAPAVVHSDSVTGGSGSVTVAGWDVFPDSLSTHVGMALNIGSAWYGFTANVANAEVPVAYPTATADHGYSDTIALAPGTYNVCIWTTEPSGAAVNSGCHSVVVTAPSPAVSNIDSVVGGVGSATVAGWDVFPDSLSTQVGMAINIGSAWYAMTANTPNSESASAYPGSTVDHGFATTLALAPGTYSLCLWTVEPSGPAVNIGCRTATVTAPPPAVGSFDTATVVAGGIQVTGYSEFPASPGTAVGVAAQIGSHWYGFTANGANVTAPGHGFTGFIPEPHGTYSVCMWTVEPSGPAVSFGCKPVTVP